MAQIFLCHASEDKPQVREVYKRLQAEGLRPWLDAEEILPGQLWEHEIPKALKASDFILIFFSQHSVSKRGYVQRELKLALDAWQEIPEGSIHTIPVRLDDCTMSEQFRRFQWVNLFEEGGFERIVRAIRTALDQPLEPATTSTSAWPATWRNSLGMEFVLIPAGAFLMGAVDGESEERPVHMVQISQPFYLGTYSVTQAQWQSITGENPSRFAGHANRPVEQVSWDDAQRFIQWLQRREPAVTYRLPTEAEWEYACRAGSTTAYSFGDDPQRLKEYAWYSDNSGGQTHDVGQLQPNAWGLCDMHGNVWEWVQDWYDADYYQHSPTVDPQGPASGSDRVIRGGSWGGGAGDCRSAAHRYAPPGRRGGALQAPADVGSECRTVYSPHCSGRAND